MVHVEITDEGMKTIANGGKHCRLIADGWVYGENEEQTEFFYTHSNIFGGQRLSIDDAFTLNKIWLDMQSREQPNDQ